METIKNYLDNVFSALPKTSEIMKLKENLLTSMEDKYIELKSLGKSENEAIGIVISEFGNIDELVKELNIPIYSQTAEETLPIVTLQVANDFISAKKISGNLVSIGVFLCIIAPAVLVFLESMSGASMFKNHGFRLEALSFIPFIILIAIAVMLFIFSGMRLEQYKYLEKPFKLDHGIEVVFQKKADQFRPIQTMGIALGVMLCILSPVSLVIFEAFSQDGFLEGIGVSVLLFMVAIAVVLFIQSGITMDAYKQLLQTEDFSPSKKQEKNNKVVAAVGSIVWPLTVVGYLLWSFLTGDWYITWIVFPIMGILFGGFSSMCNILMEKND
ncbi:MAG: hypothetical protein HGA25_03455 [Clostridiales bacterium]|nr:hypothetical protein [Clostridiales bacterium]